MEASVNSLKGLCGWVYHFKHVIKVYHSHVQHSVVILVAMAVGLP